jgi:hypothetical protein
LGYELTKYIQTGIGLIIGGFLFTLVQNLYNFERHIAISLPLQIAIPTILTAAGFGLILYDFWNRVKKREERNEQKNKRKRR